MSLIKSDEDIKAMREGGKILSRALAAAAKAVRPGIFISELEEIAEKSLRADGAVPSFKGYRGSRNEPAFPTTLCISIGPEVVHGIANRKIKLKEGDIVSLDIGCEYQGRFTDMAVTVPVGKISVEDEELMRVTREALFAGVAAAKPKGDVRDISAAVEKHVKPHGFGIVTALVGHGVGHAVHEAPNVPNYTYPRQPSVPLKPGMCLAIEPMITMGNSEVQTADDGWTAITVDNSIAAHFEVTIVITKNGHEILTPLP
ncbi:MAG: type I methionyl aminopeptidase [Patescibacteria group bacterium]|jgi:methionyl aminopeptidase